ncbi:MAG: hypothetical protein RLZZ413_3844 [Pseudomonadota bacterium]|jgi:hypothetical protein
MPKSIVISLSSIPPRFDMLEPTLSSLLTQDRPAESVILWIPHKYRRFSEWDGTLPVVPPGVTIRRCETDLGPATKVLPSLHLCAGQEVVIAFCDDDRLYCKNWLSCMISAMDEHPGCCIVAHGTDLPADVGRPLRAVDRSPRAHYVKSGMVQDIADFRRYVTRKPLRRASGYADLLHGYAGVLVCPEFFTAAVHEIPPVLWAVDDVWLSGHLENQGVPIWVDDRIPMPKHRPDVMGTAALLDAQIENHDRSAADRACIHYFRDNYSIWTPSSAELLLASVRPWGQRFAKVARRLRSRYWPTA